jgi:vacuolar-type H+-ATPase subunit H
MENEILKEIQKIEETAEKIIEETKKYAEQLINQKQSESELKIENFKKEIAQMKEEKINEAIKKMAEEKLKKEKAIEEKIKNLELKAEGNFQKALNYLKNKFFEIWQSPK